jgi:hypothetical protein
MARQDHPHSDDAQSSLVDESLIDAFLALSPEERLRQNDRMIQTILQLRQGLTTEDAEDGPQA